MSITAPAHRRTDREFAFDDRDFRDLAKLVRAQTGIVLSDAKRELVYGRLARRLRALGLESFSAYRSLLAGPEGPLEMGRMINAVTTNLTSFFREPHHFEFLAANVLKPAQAAGARPKRLRIWSAGCSSGEEPYSIAMTLRATIADLDRWDALILATDIDTDMVASGAEGIYAEGRDDGVPNAYRSRFVERLPDGRAAMSDTLRSLIRFKQLNLMEDWPMRGPFDVIFCRNVVIYFDKPTQSRLFDRFADLLTPDGWLIVGHSESLFRVTERFKPVGRTIYQRIS